MSTMSAMKNLTPVAIAFIGTIARTFYMSEGFFYDF